MAPWSIPRLAKLLATAKFQVLIFLLVVAVIGNLNALVDAFLHPEIEYFDDEHLLVGGIAVTVSGILLGLVILYARHLQEALGKINLLESFLPICANCKKVRSDEGAHKDTWQPIEAYISDRTNTRFTHSICPACLKKLYPECAQAAK